MLRLVRKRFGQTDIDVEERIGKLSLHGLESLVNSVANLTGAEELSAWFAAHPNN